MQSKDSEGLERVAPLIHQLPRAGSRATDALAELRTAKGLDIVQTFGFPKREPPIHILDEAKHATRNALYSSSRGLFELREAIARTIGAELGIAVDPRKEIVITAGAMHGLNTVFRSILSRGDEVILPIPGFFFRGIVELAGGVLKCVPMSEAANFVWDLDAIEGTITGRTKAIIVNTPVNPTGYVLTVADLERLGELAAQYSTLLVVDESYDRMVYDGRKHHSLLALPAFRNRVVMVRSFTKSYAMPGWRIGYIIAPEDIAEACVKLVEWDVLCCNHVAQRVACAALTGPQDWLTGIAEEFQANRDFIVPKVNAVHGLRCGMPQGGPYLLINVSAVAESESFANYLLLEYGIRANPGWIFESAAHIRIPFGGTRETLSRLAERLSAGTAEWQRRLSTASSGRP